MHLLAQTDLNSDHAASAFGLIFSYVTHNQSPNSPEAFKEIIQDLFQGFCPSPAVFAHLNAIYTHVLTSRPCITSLANKLVIDFQTQVDVLVSVFHLLVRYSTVDGMMSRHDGELLGHIYSLLGLQEEDLLGLSIDEQEIITRFVLIHLYEKPVPASLHQSYQVLKCSPDMSDKTLRAKYRQLAKKLHPDRVQGSDSSISDGSRFIEIQNAYETIMKSRRN